MTTSPPSPSERGRPRHQWAGPRVAAHDAADPAVPGASRTAHHPGESTRRVTLRWARRPLRSASQRRCRAGTPCRLRTGDISMPWPRELRETASWRSFTVRPPGFPVAVVGRCTWLFHVGLIGSNGVVGASGGIALGDAFAANYKGEQRLSARFSVTVGSIPVAHGNRSTWPARGGCLSLPFAKIISTPLKRRPPLDRGRPMPRRAEGFGLTP